MDRLELHDSLRIVIPGIFLAYILNSYFQLDWMTKSGVTSLLGIGVFLGLMMSPLTFKLHRKWFKKICSDFKYWDKIHRIFKRKLRLYALESSSEIIFVSKRKAICCAWGHYSDKYNDPALFSFRMPKTFAIMHFNLMISCLISILLIFLSFWFECSVRVIFVSQTYDLIILSLLLAATLIESHNKFIYSLKKELEYWTARDVKMVAELVRNAAVYRSSIPLIEI